MGDPQSRMTQLLLELSIPAADVLYDGVSSHDCLSFARLACRALRKTIDGSARALTVRVHPRHRHRWRTEQAPSLGRWPRCSALTIQINTFDDIGDDEEFDGLAHCVIILLASQPPEVQRRLTSLALQMDDAVEADSSWSSLSSLALSCPELRSLELDVNFVDPLSLKVIFHGLTGLAHLERLELANTLALEHVGLLAGTLRYLTVGAGDFDTKAVEGIFKLHRLHELKLAASTVTAETVVHLLGSLPPSTQAVSMIFVGLQRGDAMNLLDASFSLESGRMTSVQLRPPRRGPLDLRYLAALAADVLLPCRALGLQLPLLHLSHLHTTATAVQDAERLEPLQRLLRRCTRVQLGSLILTRDAGVDAAVQAVELLGFPLQLALKTLPVGTFGAELSFRLPVFVVSQSQPTSSSPPAGNATASAAGLPLHASQLPKAPESMNASTSSSEPTVPPAEVFRLAVNRLAQSGTDRPSPVLMLRGAALDLLLQSPPALNGWAAWLDDGAKQQRLATDPAAAAGAIGKQISAVAAVPPAGAIFVKCYEGPNELPAAAAVLAAASAVAAEAAAGTLEVVGVAPSWITKAWRAPPRCTLSGPLEIFMLAVREVVQEQWDAAEPGEDAAASANQIVRQRLEQLVALREEIKKLPKEVDMRFITAV